MTGFIFGTLVGQFAGSWAYWRARGEDPSAPRSKWLAATIAGVVTSVAASAIYIPSRVHIWIGGEGTSWGASVFIAGCMGICQAVLVRGRPLSARPSTTGPNRAA